MTIQRRFAPISGRFEPELLAGLAGIYTLIYKAALPECNLLPANHCP